MQHQIERREREKGKQVMEGLISPLDRWKMGRGMVDMRGGG